MMGDLGEGDIFLADKAYDSDAIRSLASKITKQGAYKSRGTSPKPKITRSIVTNNKKHCHKYLNVFSVIHIDPSTEGRLPAIVVYIDHHQP